MDVSVPFSFAFVDGGIVGCISEHPLALRYVLDAYDGRAPARAQVYWHRVHGNAYSEGSVPDCGWMRSNGAKGPFEWSYFLSKVGPKTMQGAFCFPEDLSVAADVSMDLNGLDRILDDLPLAVAAVSAEAVTKRLARSPGNKWVGIVKEVIGETKSKSLALAVLGGDYSGRLKGLKWPGLLIAFQDSGGGVEDISNVLDRLNARLQWGLIPREVSVDGHIIHVVESTADNPYAGLAFEERIAYTALDEWILIASNTDTLTKLVRRCIQAGVPREEPARRWISDMRNMSCAACGWIDLEQGAKALRLALTAYSLKLVFDDPDETQETRQRLNEAKAWINALAPLKTFRFQVEPECGTTKLRFQMGETEG